MQLVVQLPKRPDRRAGAASAVGHVPLRAGPARAVQTLGDVPAHAEPAGGVSPHFSNHSSSSGTFAGNELSSSSQRAPGACSASSSRVASDSGARTSSPGSGSSMVPLSVVLCSSNCERALGMGDGCPGREIFKGGLCWRRADVPWAPHGPLLRVARRVPKTGPRAFVEFPFFSAIFLQTRRLLRAGEKVLRTRVVLVNFRGSRSPKE